MEALPMATVTTPEAEGQWCPFQEQLEGHCEAVGEHVEVERELCLSAEHHEVCRVF